MSPNNVASEGCTRKVYRFPRYQKRSTFRDKVLRQEIRSEVVVAILTFQRRAFSRNVDSHFIVSSSEVTCTFLKNAFINILHNKSRFTPQANRSETR